MENNVVPLTFGQTADMVLEACIDDTGAVDQKHTSKLLLNLY